MNKIKNTLKELKQYPSAIVGLLLILLLLVFSLYAVIALPLNKAIALWKGADNVWAENPINAAPAWVNFFPGVKRPKTIIVDSDSSSVKKVITPIAEGMDMVEMALTFNYPYKDFPKEINIFFEANYKESAPHIDMTWLTPDKRKIAFEELSLGRSTTYRVSQNARIKGRVNKLEPNIGLLADPTLNNASALQGEYTLLIEGYTFEEASNFKARLVLYGQVHGIAGTDHKRRDLSVALLWGAPIALLFSFGITIATSFSNIFLAALGVWYGGLLDSLIQRLTEISMILPLLPILIMVSMFFSRSMWVILLTIIILNLFYGTKGYRAMFLQIKESHYIEAAKAYGASDLRIIFRYLIPRIIPTLVPSFVSAIPRFVFMEATLALIGVGDPVLPTWGKIIEDAYSKGALHNGHYYWILEPAAFLIVTGLAFAMLGFALDRIFNPRLRGL